MRSLIAAGLALLVAAHSGPVHADPGTPQLAPLHRQREDAQRLAEQLRGLDGPAVEPAATPRFAPSTAHARVRDRNAGAPSSSLGKRWWFWAALGAIALTLGVTYETTRSSAQPVPGLTCDATGCHP